MSIMEYGVWDNEENELLIGTGTDREKAFRFERRWNDGHPGRVTVVERKVSTTEWAPANTGIVPPPLRGGVEE